MVPLPRKRHTYALGKQDTLFFVDLASCNVNICPSSASALYPLHHFPSIGGIPGLCAVREFRDTGPLRLATVASVSTVLEKVFPCTTRESYHKRVVESMIEGKIHGWLVVGNTGFSCKNDA